MNKNNNNWIWLSLTLWNFMMAITFLVLGAIMAYKDYDTYYVIMDIVTSKGLIYIKKN